MENDDLNPAEENERIEAIPPAMPSEVFVPNSSEVDDANRGDGILPQVTRDCVRNRLIGGIALAAVGLIVKIGHDEMNKQLAYNDHEQSITVYNESRSSSLGILGYPTCFVLGAAFGTAFATKTFQERFAEERERRVDSEDLLLVDVESQISR